MGTWGTGPFDNDAAADFADRLDGAVSLAQREDIVWVALMRTVKATGNLTGAEQAVAAAAVIAAQGRGGAPLDTAYGPKQPLPVFSRDVRELTMRTLDRVLARQSEALEVWRDPASAHEWLASVIALRDTFDSPPSMDVPLSDL